MVSHPPYTVAPPDIITIDPAFDAITQWSADGVVVLDDPVLLVLRTKIAGAALARKLLIAFWKYVTAGIVLEGAETTAA